MHLFIKDEPFSVEPAGSGSELQRVEIRVRAAMSEPTAEAPASPDAFLEFILDTGTDYASVYPENLDLFGLTPEGPAAAVIEVTMMDNHKVFAPTRDVTLWLYSNIDGREGTPHPIYLKQGVVVLPAPDPPAEAPGSTAEASPPCLRPLLGMNCLLDAELRIEIDAGSRRFSAWIPSSQL